MPILRLALIEFWLYVTGTFVQAPRQRNNMYGNKVRISIYKTRRPKHPHLSILHSTNDSPIDPLLGPVTWNPDRTRTGPTLLLQPRYL